MLGINEFTLLQETLSVEVVDCVETL